MARPIKQGLDYFPLDVDIDTDDKIEIIIAEYGHVGFSVVIRLLSKVYKEGYFYEWPEKKAKVFASRANVEIEVLQNIVRDCAEEGIFNKRLFEAYGILTSKGIQKRYLEAVKRRKQVTFLKKYFLVDDVSGIVGSNKIAVLIEDENGVKVNVNSNPAADGETGNVKPAKKAKAAAKTPKEPKEKVVKYTAEDMEMARRFYELIQQNNPDVKEPNFDKWADDFRLMRTSRTKSREPEATRYIMEWAQNDSFWRNNILTPKKLSDKWAQLAGIIRTEHSKKAQQLAIGAQQPKGDIFGGVQV